MITLKEFPNIQFKSQEEAFAHLRKNASKLIALKKANIYKSAEKLEGCGLDFYSLEKLSSDAVKGIEMQEGKGYAVINSTRYMDSHRDVHFDGIWAKSLSEQQGKLYYAADHKLETGKIIIWPENLKSYTAKISWGLVGKSYAGETEALIFEFDKSDIANQQALEIIEKGRKVKNSVRMQYVKIRLAMNSNAKEDIEYKAYYDQKIGEIANREVAEELGYFWGVEEAKIVKEGSMVIDPSNDATALLQLDEAAQKSTLDNEPPSGTHEKQTKFFNHTIL